jgi:hypothetical protein
MDNKLTDAMSKYTQLDGDEAWEGYRQNFLRQPAARRRQELAVCDQWLDEYTQPTKEFADLWSRQRDLLRLHEKLSKAGR